MKPTLQDEILDQDTALAKVTHIAKQRGYIETHLDILGLAYIPTDITAIRGMLDTDYRAIDVAVAYGKVYRSKHDCVELYNTNNPNRYSFSDGELDLVKECVQIADSEYDLPSIHIYDLKKTLGIIK